MPADADSGNVTDPKRPPIPPELDAVIERIRKLRQAEGLTLTAIAARIGRTKKFVSDAAKLGNIRFDAESTRELCEVRLAGSRLRRAEMARRMIELAHGKLDQIDCADPADSQKLATTVGILLDKALLLERTEAEDHKSAEGAEIAARLGLDDPWGLKICT